MNPKTPWAWKTMLLILLLAFIVLLTLRPVRVEGYYRSGAITILDGSAGFLHLHDGFVDSVNVNGEHGSSRVRDGSYTVDGGRVTVSWDLLKRSDTAVVRWHGLTFPPDFVVGIPKDSVCPRAVVVPWLKRLDRIPLITREEFRRL